MKTSLPKGFISDTIRCNGITFHVVHNGSQYKGKPIEDSRKPLLCLHGFPEFWMGWKEVSKYLDKDYFVVLPDQRGCNKTEVPKGVEQYAVKELVTDMFVLASLFFGNRKFNLAGHDFGASIAYAMVFTFPSLIDKFVVVNGAHPVCFQEALIDNPKQAHASSYFHLLREEGTAKKIVNNDFEEMFEFMKQPNSDKWMTVAIREEFKTAWGNEDRLQAMFNWYKNSPMVVPIEGQEIPISFLYRASRDKYRISVPHLLLWGKQDTALLTDTYKELASFTDTLTFHEIEGADHWVLHTHAEEVANHMKEFI